MERSDPSISNSATPKVPKRRGKQSRWTEDKARKIYVAWQQSGMSQSQFCREQGIGIHRLSWWKKRLSRGTKDELKIISSVGSAPPKKRQSGGFVEAMITSNGKESAAVVISLRSGDRIEVRYPEQVEPSWLLQLARGFGARNG